MVPERARVDSSSTVADYDTNSIFSDNSIAFTSTQTLPCSTFGDGECSLPELEEIDKDTFTNNISQMKRADSVLHVTPAPSPSAPKFINGSTIGGVDPLDRLLREHDLEPEYWQQCREETRLHNVPPKKQNECTQPSTSPPDPKHYDRLPFSREVDDRAMTSGFDISLDPVSSEVFWETLKARWDLSMWFETVEERREILDMMPWFDDNDNGTSMTEGSDVVEDREEGWRGEKVTDSS